MQLSNKIFTNNSLTNNQIGVKRISETLSPSTANSNFFPDKHQDKQEILEMTY